MLMIPGQEHIGHLLLYVSAFLWVLLRPEIDVDVQVNSCVFSGVELR